MRAWIEKQRSLIDFTLSSLGRRKVKNVGLFALYALIVFILASVMFFTSSIKREAALILRGAPEIIVQRMVAGRHDLFPLRFLETIRSIRGVASVESRLWGYSFDSATGANYTLLSPPVEKIAARNTDAPVETAAVAGDEDGLGARDASRPLFEFRAAALEPGTIIVGNGVARVRHIGRGDVVPLRAFDGRMLEFKVADLLSSQSELVSSDLILMTEEDVRRLFGIEKSFATDVAVAVTNPSEIDMVASKIAKLLPETRPIVRDEILRTYDAVFNWRGGMMIVIFSAALLAFVIFAWDKASGLSAEERREIGILKAIGWETSDVIRMKFWEGAVISLAAFLVGVILAYVHVFFTESVVFGPALKGWSRLYPHFALTPFVGAGQLVSLFVLTVVPYTVATIVPTWKASIIDPDAAMKQTGE
jgi:hypothetical protein